MSEQYFRNLESGLKSSWHASIERFWNLTTFFNFRALGLKNRVGDFWYSIPLQSYGSLFKKGDENFWLVCCTCSQRRNFTKPRHGFLKDILSYIVWKFHLNLSSCVWVLAPYASYFAQKLKRSFRLLKLCKHERISWNVLNMKCDIFRSF